MSMSQEEIEALMNGLDIVEDDKDETVEKTNDDLISEDDIESLIANNEETIKEEVSNDEPVSNDDIDDLLKGLETNEVDETSNDSENVNNDDFDDILSGVDFSKDFSEETIEETVNIEEEKVVNQLVQVANDSEENVSKIFDVLSDILDNNNNLQNNLNQQDTFLLSQIKLLESLNSKFPNIDIFKTNLDTAVSLENEMKALVTDIDNKNMQIFEAMELMQFNDINRQKIERVMSVIKKLANYLNNLFEDESNGPEVSVARHIHGDENNDLAGDDLDSLIKEFGK